MDPEGTGTLRGCNPLLETARGKLQSKRSKLNDQINRELRMRAGAENLFRATNNKKMRETIALELQFVNSSLQLLKEELSELNSSVEVYQNDESSTPTVPMIPLGLKETNELNFSGQFNDYIQEHYNEDPVKFEFAIQQLKELRQSIRTPSRSVSGVNLLFQYYNQLYFVEKRFFPTNKAMSIYFHWYDSLTGIPSGQRTVGFEKGSILFNIGALYTQIGCRQDRSKMEGLNAAIDSFQKAAGSFYYLHDRFSHAPSMDMQPQTLIMLVQLMMSQAQECVCEKQILGGLGNNAKKFLEVSRETAQVSRMYHETHKMMTSAPLQDYVPFSWISMVLVKAEHFQALSHFYTASALTESLDVNDNDVLEKMFCNHHVDSQMNTVPTAVPQNTDERKTVGKCHLREALMLHEDALRVHDLCKQLRQIDTVQDVLKRAHDRSLEKFENLEEEDDFSEGKPVDPIRPVSVESVHIVQPDLALYKVEDMFHKLGPIAIFSAKHQWSAPKPVQLCKSDSEGFGFSVRGDAPVIIALVDEDSRAQEAGMKVGDFLVGVNDHDTKWSKHEEIVSLIRSSGNNLRLKLITPMDHDYLKPRNSTSSTLSGLPTSMQTPNGSIASGRSGKSRSRLGEWMFKKKDSTRDRSRHKSAPEDPSVMR